jgi:AcrR family transcriptional regulator
MSSLGGQSRISQPRSAKNKKNRPLRVRNRGARERALIEAAAKLFADRGYEHTTTREIAAKAGCAEGLISRYFKGKSGLLKKLVDLQISHKQTPPPPFPSTIQEEVRRLVDEEVQHLWDDRQFLKMVIPQMILDPALGRQLTQIPDRRASAIVERLRSYKECADFSADELTALATSIIGLGFLFGFWRPIALAQNRDHAKRMAVSMALILSRAF